MNIPEFTAEKSLCTIKEYYQETERAYYTDQLILSFIVARHPPDPLCLLNCKRICRSDPNISDFNDCNRSCFCSCSGGVGCWQ